MSPHRVSDANAVFMYSIQQLTVLEINDSKLKSRDDGQGDQVAEMQGHQPLNNAYLLNRTSRSQVV